MQLAVRNLTKRYKTGDGVSDINLTVEQGELVTLLGPSGCGKTTVLRSIGGFLEPDSGDILIEGRSVVGLPPEKRPTSMVFQSYNLWSHMSVYDNLAFGLKIRKMPKAEIRAAVADALKLVRLSGYEKKHPAELSAVSSNASLWPGRCCFSRPCCCWTSLSRRWTRSCATRCARSFARSKCKPDSRWFS